MFLSQGIIPEELKIVNVISLYKNDDSRLFNDYKIALYFVTIELFLYHEFCQRSLKNTE